MFLLRGYNYDFLFTPLYKIHRQFVKSGIEEFII